MLTMMITTLSTIQRITQLKDGNFLLIWREYSRSNNNQNEVFGQKYFKTGEKIGDSFVISSNG